MTKASDLPPTPLHFSKPPSDNCTGFAHLFRVGNICSNDAVFINHDILRHRLAPTECDSSYVYFMDCPNHVNYDMKAQGTLSIIFFKSTDTYNLSFILVFDTCLTVAICHNTSCFFKEYVYEPQHYFRTVKTIHFDEIYSNNIKIYYVNQLSQFRPFREHSSDYIPTWLISLHDFKFNSSPFGPDRLLYEQYEADALMDYCSNQCNTSTFTSNIDFTPITSNTSTTRSSKSIGKSRAGLLTLRPSEKRLTQEYTSFNFGLPIESPPHTFAIPYCHLQCPIDNNGLSYRKFAFVTRDELHQIIQQYHNMSVIHFDEHLSHYPSILFPVVDPINVSTENIAIINTTHTHTTHKQQIFSTTNSNISTNHHKRSR